MFNRRKRLKVVVVVHATRSRRFKVVGNGRRGRSSKLSTDRSKHNNSVMHPLIRHYYPDSCFVVNLCRLERYLVLQIVGAGLNRGFEPWFERPRNARICNSATRLPALPVTFAEPDVPLASVRQMARTLEKNIFGRILGDAIGRTGIFNWDRCIGDPAKLLQPESHLTGLGRGFLSLVGRPLAQLLQLWGPGKWCRGAMA
jgi:hypothetical protein